jgi:hypothetical protein
MWRVAKNRVHEMLVQAKKEGWKNVTNNELVLKVNLQGEATLKPPELRSRVTMSNIFMAIIDDEVLEHLKEQAEANMNNHPHKGRGRHLQVSKSDLLKLVAWYVRVCGEQWPSLQHAWSTCSDLPISRKVHDRIRKWMGFNPVELFRRFNAALKRVMQVE